MQPDMNSTFPALVGPYNPLELMRQFSKQRSHSQQDVHDTQDTPRYLRYDSQIEPDGTNPKSKQPGTQSRQVSTRVMEKKEAPIWIMILYLYLLVLGNECVPPSLTTAQMVWSEMIIWYKWKGHTIVVWSTFILLQEPPQPLQEHHVQPGPPPAGASATALPHPQSVQNSIMVVC